VSDFRKIFCCPHLAVRFRFHEDHNCIVFCSIFTSYFASDLTLSLSGLIMFRSGWLFGMHANIDTWWSRATMAYFFGMYVNGIAVYGRDPLLTCEYARFVSEDQRCPSSHDSDRLKDFSTISFDVAWDLLSTGIYGDNLQPSDWKNCSSRGYHP
jgi:hypothetical protein